MFEKVFASFGMDFLKYNVKDDNMTNNTLQSKKIDNTQQEKVNQEKTPFDLIQELKSIISKVSSSFTETGAKQFVDCCNEIASRAKEFPSDAQVYVSIFSVVANSIDLNQQPAVLQAIVNQQMNSVKMQIPNIESKF